LNVLGARLGNFGTIVKDSFGLEDLKKWLGRAIIELEISADFLFEIVETEQKMSEADRTELRNR
jgi:hypothetical protein